MIQDKLRVETSSGDLDGSMPPLIPVTTPTVEEIRFLADRLHARGQEYEDEVWGWPVSYEPEWADPPLDSRLTFTPASFWIGVWPIWYVSLTWEHGCDHEPGILISEEDLAAQVT